MCLEFEAMSHGEKEKTEDYKNKAMEVTEAPLAHRVTEIVYQFY